MWNGKSDRKVVITSFRAQCNAAFVMVFRDHLAESLGARYILFGCNGYNCGTQKNGLLGAMHPEKWLTGRDAPRKTSPNSNYNKFRIGHFSAENT